MCALGHDSCQPLQVVLALPLFHRAMLRDGRFRPVSGTLAGAFKTEATLELSDVSKSSSKNRPRLCLVED